MSVPFPNHINGPDCPCQPVQSQRNGTWVHGTLPGDLPETAPASGHTVAWVLKEYCSIESTFTCHEPEGADCREYCQGQCEDGPLVCDTCKGYGHEPRTDRHCARCGTPITPCECIKVEWMDNDGGLDCYAGPTVPLHDGPVEFVWQNDYFDWHYKETP